jgi:hypothetical protein
MAPSLIFVSFLRLCAQHGGIAAKGWQETGGALGGSGSRVGPWGWAEAFRHAGVKQQRGPLTVILKSRAGGVQGN